MPLNILNYWTNKKKKQHPPCPVAWPAAHPVLQDVHWIHAANATRYVTATVNAKWNIGQKGTAQNANDWKQPPKPKWKRKHYWPRRKQKMEQTKNEGGDVRTRTRFLLCAPRYLPNVHLFEHCRVWYYTSCNWYIKYTQVHVACSVIKYNIWPDFLVKKEIPVYYVLLDMCVYMYSWIVFVSCGAT